MNRRPHLLAHLRRRFAGDDGFALVLTLGVMVVLGMSTSGALMFVTQNQGSAARSKADAAVLSVAEAGINNAMSVLSNPANDPTNPTLLPARTDVYDAGSVTWWGTYDAPTSTWTVTATGEMRNPTGVSAAPVRRRVSAQVSVVAGSSPVSPLQNPSWNYTVATRTSAVCDLTVSASVIAGVPLFTMLDATIGTLATPIPRADVGGGCAGHLCSAADRVFASIITPTAPTMTPPAADWDYWYANAAPGPKTRASRRAVHTRRSTTTLCATRASQRSTA